MILKVQSPDNCKGSFSDCQRRDPSLTEAQWYRGQMRCWAGYWREHRAIAALLGKTAAEIAETHISLAKSYRDSALKLEAAR